jgi:hypothetical protein
MPEGGLETLSYDGTYVDGNGKLVINWALGPGAPIVGMKVQYIKSPGVGTERLENSGGSEEANNTGGLVTLVPPS